MYHAMKLLKCFEWIEHLCNTFEREYNIFVHQDTELELSENLQNNISKWKKFEFKAKKRYWLM